MVWCGKWKYSSNRKHQSYLAKSEVRVWGYQSSWTFKGEILERRESQRRNPKICVKIPFKHLDDSELDMFRERIQETQQEATI